jgi:hypothetical protein
MITCQRPAGMSRKRWWRRSTLRVPALTFEAFFMRRRVPENCPAVGPDRAKSERHGAGKPPSRKAGQVGAIFAPTLTDRWERQGVPAKDPR